MSPWGKVQHLATIQNDVLSSHQLGQRQRFDPGSDILLERSQQGIFAVQSVDNTTTVAKRFSFVSFFAVSRRVPDNFMPHVVGSNPGLTEFIRMHGEQMTASDLSSLRPLIHPH